MRNEVPVPEECADIAHVWFAHDPEWRGYSSYAPSRPGLLRRISTWWKSLFSKAGGTPIAMPEGSGADDDQGVI